MERIGTLAATTPEEPGGWTGSQVANHKQNSPEGGYTGWMDRIDLRDLTYALLLLSTDKERQQG